jgi:hypothetical protein
VIGFSIILPIAPMDGNPHFENTDFASKELTP